VHMSTTHLATSSVSPSSAILDMAGMPCGLRPDTADQARCMCRPTHILAQGTFRYLRHDLGVCDVYAIELALIVASRARDTN
jgi:hypothetical protein